MVTYPGSCVHCGQPGHRYGSTDPDHEPTMVACINGLNHELDQLRAICQAILGPGRTAGDFRSRYLAGKHERRCLSAIVGVGSAQLTCSLPAGHTGHHSDGVASWTRHDTLPPICDTEEP